MHLFITCQQIVHICSQLRKDRRSVKSYQQDLTKLSTENLVVCWGLLHERARDAEHAGHLAVRDFYVSRRNEVGRELNSRQTTLDDELELLRARQQPGPPDVG
jgi:hypothetical protein